VWVCRLHRLNSAGETSPPWATPARMTRHVDVADWKDVQNVHQPRYDVRSSPDKVGNSRRLACREAFDPRGQPPVVKFLLTLSTRQASCSVVLCLGQNPNRSSCSSQYTFTSRRTLVSTIFSKSCQQIKWK
jgi:hypothetical protein